MVIQEVEKGLRKKNWKSPKLQTFGIPSNILSTILKNKEKILSNVGMDKGKARKGVKGPENPDVDQCVLKWFKHAHDKKNSSKWLFSSSESGRVRLKPWKKQF